jgi:hypothetical protein
VRTRERGPPSASAEIPFYYPYIWVEGGSHIRVANENNLCNISDKKMETNETILILKLAVFQEVGYQWKIEVE